MRALAIDPLPGAPPHVRGASIVRGAVVPVIDAAVLIGADSEDDSRFVTLRAGERTLALLVHDIVGVRSLAPSLDALVPMIDAIGGTSRMDETVVLFLE